MTPASAGHPLPPDLDEQTVFRSMFGAYPDALLLVDAEGRIVLANPAADTLFGYEPGQLVRLTVDALVPDSIRPRHANYRKAYAQNPRSRPMGTQMDLVAKRRDGSEVMVEIALSPLPVTVPPYIVVAIRGIGAYPRVRQALQRARYSEHVAQMGRLAVDALDPQILLQHVPEVAAEALQVKHAVLFLLDAAGGEFTLAAGIGLLPGETIGMRVANRPDSGPGVALADGRLVAVDDFRREALRALPPTYLDAGIVSALAVPLVDRGRAVGVLGVRSEQAQRFGDDEFRFLESLSNLVAATLQRVQTEETLNHAQRLESVGQLTGGIAHDFNNLLTVIQGNLQVLEGLPAFADDGHAQQLVAAAARASKRGAELTSKLLAFSRRQVLSPSKVEVPALLHSLADMLGRTLDQRIRIEVSSSPNCPPCLADAGQLESSLLNIAINARDAMPGGGVLTFSAQACDRLPPELHGEFGLDEAILGYTAIAMSDTGHGMSDTIKERAFEPFFTTKESGRGTGLGLSTVYGFVKQSHGAITLNSAPGAGTTVTLYIPRAAPLQPRTEPPPRKVSLPSGLRVLMVEDEPEVRAVAQHFLTAFGCVITPCISAEEALVHLSDAGRFDLLLSDVALGTGMRGTDLAKQAQACHPAMAVLLVSGYSAQLLDINETAPLSWELLAKPYSREELQSAMAQALSRAQR